MAGHQGRWDSFEMSSAGRKGVLERARRFWQVHPGDPNVLSTAGSFSPPVGGRIRPDGRGGYYIDFTIKSDEAVFPPSWHEGPERELYVATAQFGLGCFERYLAGHGEQWLDTARATAEHLIDQQAADGSWVHLTSMPHSYWIEPPWVSAMAQGEGASLLVRIHGETGDDRYAEAAIRALDPMRVPTSKGGASAELGGGVFLEEYPSNPPSMVLNGALFAIWGCRDVALALADEGAAQLHREALDTLAANIHRYDTGFWSLYDLFPHPVRNVASGAYHRLHITQLKAQQLAEPRPEFAQALANFERYETSAACRNRALAQKVAFRLLVPRNERLAHRLPWAHRPEHGEVVVLCYHAVSDEWPSRLAVTRRQLREHVGHFVGRGYHPVTFTEAVTQPADGRPRLAVTFDDGYASLEDNAAPILAELGVPATVFVPTAYVGTGEPMSWPGIEPWLATPHRDELLPLDWDGVRRLAGAGWEIGSHSHSHPRLTQIDDADLTRELRESRRILEEQLGGPCRSIAYPYGDVDERVLVAAREAGYIAGGALPSRLHVPRPLSWPRLGIYRADDQARYLLKTSRSMRALRRLPAWLAVRKAAAAGKRLVTRSD
jgi:peptidoglycan/xylan/chitin deacetylase (PgdA/CDA1 family)